MQHDQRRTETRARRHAQQIRRNHGIFKQRLIRRARYRQRVADKNRQQNTRQAHLQNDPFHYRFPIGFPRNEF